MLNAVSKKFVKENLSVPMYKCRRNGPQKSDITLSKTFTHIWISGSKENFSMETMKRSFTQPFPSQSVLEFKCILCRIVNLKIL